MQKLAKRTLAFLLVVCTLFGLLAVPAAATDGETTEATPKTFTYDFTALSNKDGQYEFDAEHVAWNTSNTDFFGFGGITTRTAKTYDVYAVAAINAFYNEGKLTWTSNKVEHTTELDLNWAFLTEGQIKDRESQGIVTFGGYNYNNQSQIAGGKITEKIAKYYNGIEYAPKFVNDAGATKGAATGWFAVKIKAPDVGLYSVSLDYTKTNYGSRDVSVLLLPGVASDEEIVAAINAGTGKLENSVNFFADKYTEVIPDTELREDRIYARPITYYPVDGTTHPGKVKGDAGLPGNVAELGTVDITAPVEEYTVIFVANKGRYNETEETSATTNYTANIYLDGLRLTSVEVSAEEPYTVPYNFSVAHTQGIQKDSLLTDATVAETLSANYATSGWDYLGTTFTGTTKVYRYSAYYGWLVFNGAGANGYIAFKLKSPGAGNYKLDMTGHAYIAPDKSETSTKGKTTHLHMDAYIVKLDDTMSETDYAQHLAKAEKIGTYDPAYKSFAEQALDSNPGALDFAKRMHTDEITAGYEFEEGAEYILYLQKNPGADTSVSDGDNEFSPADAYISSINATFVPKTVATIGKDYTPPADKDYVFTRRAEGIVSTYATTTGTLDNTEGGYPIITEERRDVTVEYNGESLTNKILAPNWAVLRYYNSVAASGGNVYWHTDYDANNSTAKINTKDNIINYNLKRFLDSNYNTSGWQLLGSSKANNGLIFNDGYMQSFNIDQDNYVAFKLQSPGTGNFELDMKVYHPAVTGDVEGRHQGMLIYIVEADKAVYSVDNNLKLTATLPETPNAVYAPAYTMNEAEKATVDAPLMDYNDPTKSFTYSFEEGKEYIVYIVRDNRDGVNYSGSDGKDIDDVLYSTPNHMYLNGIYAKSISEAFTAEKCTTLTEALDEAEAGETVYLQSDIIQCDVSVPEGVTLDLNGYKLTTSNFTTVEGGKITDSVGTGLLNTLARGATFLGDNPLAENTLPIYDAANTGYRFFEYSYSAWGADDDSQYKNGIEGAVRFWYQILFEDDSAYELIAAGNSGVQLGVNVNLNGKVVQECSFKYADESESTWMQDWASAKAEWLWVRIQDAADVEGLSITPVISVGGADIELAPVQ